MVVHQLCIKSLNKTNNYNNLWLLIQRLLGMKFLSEGIEYLQKHVSFYFLNMLLLIANVLVGFYTQYYSVMFSSLAAITICTYLYDADHASINMKSMDMIVIISILFPIAFLWFQQGHPTRVYAGLSYSMPSCSLLQTRYIVYIQGRNLKHSLI